VHHGILHPNKGNDKIITALSELIGEAPHLKYLLIGDGPDMPVLKTLVQKRHMENCVIFTGWLPSLQELNEALNAADIGLAMRIGLPSDNFHVTGALLHSLAVGLPVLAANLGGMREVVRNGMEGFLFEPSDMESFKKYLLRLVNDSALREQMRSLAIARAKELFNPEIVTCQTVETLAGLLDEDVK
jgi:glycosyltransferase involved in cell wall biosynthesis